MKIYVINLKKRPEKLQKFFDRLPKCFNRTDIRIFEGIDGNSVNIPEWFKTYNAPCLPGRYGCYQSHLSILKTIIEPTLIFEDDVIFSDTFTQQYNMIQQYFSLVKNYDIFYLGGKHKKEPLKYRDYPNVYRCIQTHRTHAYMVSGISSAQKIIQYLEDPIFWKQTVTNINYHVDHIYGKLQLLNYIKAYCILPSICGQESCDISDVAPQYGKLKERWGHTSEWY